MGRWRMGIALSALVAMGATPGVSAEVGETAAGPSPGNVIVVNRLFDGVGGGPGCTLREAVRAANENTGIDYCNSGSGSGIDVIVLPAGRLRLTVSGAAENQAHTGDLDITDHVVIRGAGQGRTVIDAGGAGGLDDRVFHIDPLSAGVFAVLEEVTITGGNVGGGAGFGGGILSQGNLEVFRASIRGNRAIEGGGIRAASGSLGMAFSDVSRNLASTETGGVEVLSANASLTNVTVSGNRSLGHAGGIGSFGGSLQITHATIARNVADSNGDGSGDGGGIYRLGGSVSVRNSILALNEDRSPNPGARRPDCSGTVGSQGHNLIGSLVGCTFNGTPSDDQGNPRLGPLKYNGGDSFTHAIKKSSPARDAIPKQSPDCVPHSFTDRDQRGVKRPVKGACDIGAYEYIPCFGRPVNVVAFGTNVVLKGTNKADVILGQGGNDRLAGRGGNDRICGGGGRDRLTGGPGDDRMHGGPKRDVCIGGPGKDRGKSCESSRGIP